MNPQHPATSRRVLTPFAAALIARWQIRNRRSGNSTASKEESSFRFLCVPMLALVLLCMLPQRVGATPAPDKAEVAKGWMKTKFPNADMNAARHSQRTFPLTGKEVHRVKSFDPQTNLPIHVAFDGAGNELPDHGAALEAAERHATWMDRGAITPDLAAKMGLVSSNETIPVAIWLRASEPPAMKREETTNPYAAESDRFAREQVQADVKSGFLADAKDVTSAKLNLAKGVPMVTANLTVAEITALAWSHKIGWIDWSRPMVPQTNTRVTWQQSTKAQSSLSPNNYGNSVKICVIDQYLPLTSVEYLADTNGWLYNPASESNAWGYPNPDYHSAAVVGAIKSTNGAPVPQGNAALADIYFYSAASPGQQFVDNLDVAFGAVNCVNWAAPIWNYSFTCNDLACRTIFDYFGSHSPWPFITIPSGNISGGNAQVTNWAHNSLTVGGVDDNNSTGRTDDSIDTASCYGNPPDFDGYDTHMDWELPHVVAPTTAQRTADVPSSYNGGTSIASAQVAGIAAQMTYTNSGLIQWPEATRALLICSADIDVDQGRLNMNQQESSLDDRDGAGEVNAQLANQLSAPANFKNPDNTPTPSGYGYHYLQNSTGTGMYQVAANQYWSHVYSGRWSGSDPSSNPRMRVVLTWDAHTDCSAPPADVYTYDQCSSSNIDADIDLMVLRHGDNHNMGFSYTWYSNWEMVEFVPENGVQYDFYLSLNNWDNPYTYYAIAWNTATYPAN